MIVTLLGSNGLIKARPVLIWRVLGSKVTVDGFAPEFVVLFPRALGDPALPTTTRRVLNFRSSNRSSPPLGLRTRGWSAVAPQDIIKLSSAAGLLGMVTDGVFVSEQLIRVGALINELLKPSPA